MSESEQTAQAEAAPAMETGGGQSAEASTAGAGALEAAPTDKGWLQDMESIRGSNPPPDLVWRITEER